MERKGTIDMWMWMAGGIIIAILIFSISLIYLGDLVDDKKERDTVSGFSVLKDKINMWCYQYKGSMSDRIMFPLNSKIYRLFVTNNTYFERYSDNRNIYLESVVKGDILCIQFNDNSTRCFKLSCDAEMNEINFKTNSFLKNLISDVDSTIYFGFVIYKNESKVDVKYYLVS